MIIEYPFYMVYKKLHAHPEIITKIYLCIKEVKGANLIMFITNKKERKRKKKY